jgi:RNA polymerase-interacting CarD/CdnL/TRCF family regulator
MMIVGNKIVYPAQGPCLVGPIVKRLINDSPVMFYQLTILNEGGGLLFVPVSKVSSVGMRPLLSKSEIPKLLDHLKKPTKGDDTWRERIANNLKLFATGSAFDLAEIVESLTELSERKSLSFAECKRLDQARALLICEICEVTGETKEEAELQVNDALKARVNEVTPGLTTEGGPANAFDKKRERKEIFGLGNRNSQRARAQGI